MHNLQRNLLLATLEQSRCGICVIDSTDRIVLANRVYADKLGLDADAGLLGEGFLSSHGRLSAPAMLHKLANIAEPDFSVELLVHGLDGTKRYVLLQARTIEVSEKFRSISAIDITDYGLTRDRFIELKRQLDAMMTAVVVVDARAPDMPITYVNSYFEAMTGYKREETVGRNCRFLQGRDTQQDGLKQVRHAIQLKQACRVRLKNYRKDGTPFLNELFISPVLDERGEPVSFIGVQRAIPGEQAH
jgi:PAS domain S-box-containing protein